MSTTPDTSPLRGGDYTTMIQAKHPSVFRRVRSSDVTGSASSKVLTRTWGFELDLTPIEAARLGDLRRLGGAVREALRGGGLDPAQWSVSVQGAPHPEVEVTRSVVYPTAVRRLESVAERFRSVDFPPGFPHPLTAPCDIVSALAGIVAGAVEDLLAEARARVGSP